MLTFDDILLGLTARGIIHEIEHRSAEHLACRIAEHFRHRVIHIAGLGFGVDGPDSFMCRFDQSSVARFAFTQSELHFFAGVNVLNVNRNAAGHWKGATFNPEPEAG